MKINWNYIKAFLLLAVVFFLFAFADRRNEGRVVAEIDLQFTNDENLYLTEEAVNKLLIQNKVKPGSIGKEALDLNRVEALLESHNMIENAEVFMSVDGKMGAAITQRKPLARVIDSEPYYLDRRGLKMPLSQYHSARVPFVTGASEENLEELHALVSHIRNDGFLTRNIIRIHRKRNGYYELFLRETDFTVLLGTGKNMELKFKNFKAFYQKALQDKKLQDYEKIDLRFGNQVVCTKK